MEKKPRPPDKKSFLLYCDQYNLIGKLSDEQAGVLIKNIFSYCCNGRITPKIDDPLVDMVFTSLQISLDRDNKKYLKIVERNRNNGQLGGRPKKPKKPSGLSGNPKNPSEPDSDSDSDSDSGKEIHSRIVVYLNKKTGKKFRVGSKETVSKINARLNDGYNAEDFKTVIDNKVSDYNNGKFEYIYLRPETLFGKKFEGYLNQSAKPVNGEEEWEPPPSEEELEKIKQGFLS